MWSSEQIELLRGSYATEDLESLAASLGKTISCVHKRASTLGIRRPRHRTLHRSLCKCGCGAEVVSEKRRVQFIKNHDKRLSPVDYIVDSNGCWIWQGASDRSGYGGMTRKGKHLVASRVYYEKFVGQIPDGYVVCHSCDNPPCVNPDHLFTGTQKDNIADMYRKGRALTELKHPQATLTYEDAIEVRRLHATGKKQTEIARMFNASQSHISRIVTNKIRRSEPCN